LTRVKICGLTKPDDARFAVDAGADALGFVLERTSPRCIDEDHTQWIADLSPFVIKVAVFGRVDRAAAKAVFDLTQGAEWEILAEAAPKRIHVLRLRGASRADDFVKQTINAGALLVDAFREDAWGGTGHRVNWDVAAEIVQRAERPVLLAGGLTPENVAEAVRRVRPYAVDVSSGVEKSPGIKDWDKVRAFIEAAKAA
jgi:phosphoribosylanthranilate isomerase